MLGYFFKGRDNRIIAKVPSGKIAFLDRNSSIIPNPGEIWNCQEKEIVSRKTGKTLIFLNPIEKVWEIPKRIFISSINRHTGQYQTDVDLPKDVGKVVGNDYVYIAPADKSFQPEWQQFYIVKEIRNVIITYYNVLIWFVDIEKDPVQDVEFTVKNGKVYGESGYRYAAEVIDYENEHLVVRMKNGKILKEYYPAERIFHGPDAAILYGLNVPYDLREELEQKMINACVNHPQYLNWVKDRVMKSIYPCAEVYNNYRFIDQRHSVVYWDEIEVPIKHFFNGYGAHADVPDLLEDVHFDGSQRYVILEADDPKYISLMIETYMLGKKELIKVIKELYKSHSRCKVIVKIVNVVMDNGWSLTWLKDVKIEKL